MKLQIDNHRVFQYLFYVFLVVVPILHISLREFHIDAIYILAVIFLGFGFSHKSKWFLLFFCMVVVATVSWLGGTFGKIDALLVRLFVYSTVTFIAVAVIKQHNDRKEQKLRFVHALAKFLDSRDPYTANHSENVANYALKIAQEMRLSQEQCEAIHIGGLLHDIGKIGVPESILTKPSRLTNDEFEIIKRHPVQGYEALKHMSFFKKNGVLDIILYHHERYDGKGYPVGLKGEEIPLVARIMSLADSFDAMTSNRVYRFAMDLDYVVKEIEKNKGIQYDPEIADVFLNILKKEGTKIFTSSQEYSCKEKIKTYS